MKTTEYLQNFYQNGAEEQRLTTRQGQVEFIITTDYIDKYLKLGNRILEVGCGTGRYSLYYARKGYRFSPAWRKRFSRACARDVGPHIGARGYAARIYLAYL